MTTEEQVNLIGALEDLPEAEAIYFFETLINKKYYILKDMTLSFHNIGYDLCKNKIDFEIRETPEFYILKTLLDIKKNKNLYNLSVVSTKPEEDGPRVASTFIFKKIKITSILDKRDNSSGKPVTYKCSATFDKFETYFPLPERYNISQFMTKLDIKNIDKRN